ncbi:MAG: prepilin-type N-terminal cleavage/methylation domain-containing protein [Candidatus Rokubacteria bacterium]|nr:prepilin-type N-terminal cleavage/methylation domain-containing protein [Candidatus Rokubacteria bacterium]
MTRTARGFTLVELIIALALVGSLLVVAFGGLRMSISAWRRGDERSEAQQHVRGLTVSLARAIGAAHAYNGVRQQGETPVVLFNGEEERIEFVTQASPFPTPTPVAFTAVVIEMQQGERPGLVVRQRLLPNYDPFTAATPVLEDEGVTSLKLSYLGDGGWQSTWDPGTDNALPRAVRLTIDTATGGGGDRELPSLTVSIGGPRR